MQSIFLMHEGRDGWRCCSQEVRLPRVMSYSVRSVVGALRGIELKGALTTATVGWTSPETSPRHDAGSVFEVSFE